MNFDSKKSTAPEPAADSPLSGEVSAEKPAAASPASDAPAKVPETTPAASAAAHRQTEEEELAELTRELEKSTQEEVRRITGQESGISGPKPVMAPDFRPEMPRLHHSTHRAAYFFAILASVLAIAATVSLLLFLWKEFQASETPAVSSEAPVSSAASEKEELPSKDSASSLPSDDIPSDSSDFLPPFPSSGYSSADAVLSKEAYEKNTANDAGRLLFSVRAEIPKITYSTNPRAEAAINRYLDELFDGYLEDAKKQAGDYAENCGEEDEAGNCEILCSILSPKKEILTLMVIIRSQTGGASPLVTVDCYNFLAKTGEILPLQNAVTDLKALAELAVRHIDKELVWTDIYEQIILETVCDSWYPTLEGLVLVYQKYSVGPGASGTIEVAVPYGELEGLLCDELADD